jgi:hypothetical protein
MFHSYYPSLLCAVCTQDPWPQNKCKQILWIQSLTDAQNLGELLSLHLCAEVAQHEHHSDNVAHQTCIVVSSPPATLPPIYYLAICHFQFSRKGSEIKHTNLEKNWQKAEYPDVQNSLSLKIATPPFSMLTLDLLPTAEKFQQALP